MAKAKGKKRKIGAGDVASNRYASYRRGLTLVPTRIYFKGPHAKIEIALARGKDLYDKRQTLRERESKRDMERGIREARR
jgi:tmRNA-binding protein